MAERGHLPVSPRKRTVASLGNLGMEGQVLNSEGLSGEIVQETPTLTIRDSLFWFPVVSASFTPFSVFAPFYVVSFHEDQMQQEKGNSKWFNKNRNKTKHTKETVVSQTSSKQESPRNLTDSIPNTYHRTVDGAHVPSCAQLFGMLAHHSGSVLSSPHIQLRPEGRVSPENLVPSLWLLVCSQESTILIALPSLQEAWDGFET